MNTMFCVAMRYGQRCVSRPGCRPHRPRPRRAQPSNIEHQNTFILKPPAASCGKGIYIVKDAEEVDREEQAIAQRYVTNPLLIGGYKLDLRMYAAVTSFDPLRIYLFDEVCVRPPRCVRTAVHRRKRGVAPPPPGPPPRPPPPRLLAFQCLRLTAQKNLLRPLRFPEDVSLKFLACLRRRPLGDHWRRGVPANPPPPLLQNPLPPPF